MPNPTLFRFPALAISAAAIALAATYSIHSISAARLADTVAVGDIVELEPTIQQVRTTEEIINKLQRKHYEKRKLNDAMSDELLDNYLSKLDPSKSFFTLEDLAQFEDYRDKLDNAMRRGNLSPGFTIFNLYRHKVDRYFDALLDELDTRIAQLDFAIDETISLEPDTLQWAANDVALRDRQRKNLKNAVLGLRLDERINQDIDDALALVSEHMVHQRNAADSESNATRSMVLADIATDLAEHASKQLAALINAELANERIYSQLLAHANGIVSTEETLSKIDSNGSAKDDINQVEKIATLPESFRQSIIDQYILDRLTRRFTDQHERIAQLNAEDVFQLYINALAELYDPHTSYLSPKISENFSIQMRLSLEGIGALLSRDGEFTVVERLIPGGPAKLQGELAPGDRIIGVGQGDNGDIVNVIGWRLDEVVELIRGKKKSLVRLRVENAAQRQGKLVSIVRDTVKLEEQSAQATTMDLVHEGSLRKIGVITIPTFYIDFEGVRRGDENYKSTTRDVARLIDELQEQNVDGIIVDLRGNGGGALQEVNQLLGLFVERGPVVQIRYANGRIEPESNYPNPNFVREPIAVLIDRLSASASEIFAGAIQDYQRGIVVGSQSFGKGTVQQLAELSHGSLKLTQAKFYRISGESTQHRGVVPDIVLPSLYDAQDIGENALDHALDWDTIAGLRHRDYGDIDVIEPQLRALHRARIENDPDFQYLQNQIALNEKYSAIHSLPLHEENRRRFIAQDRSERAAIESSYRKARGLSPSGTKEDDSTVGHKTAEALTAHDGVEAEADRDPRSEFMLTETAYILLDSIKLSAATAAQAVASQDSLLGESINNPLGDTSAPTDIWRPVE